MWIDDIGEPAICPMERAAMNACARYLAGDELDDYDIDALAALVHALRNERAPLPEI